jgi:hypothetical protein
MFRAPDTGLRVYSSASRQEANRKFHTAKEAPQDRSQIGTTPQIVHANLAAKGPMRLHFEIPRIARDVGTVYLAQSGANVYDSRMEIDGKRSLLAEAWQRTELRGLKKIFTTVGAGLLTLGWNYKMRLRPWQLTEWFGICIVAAWLSLTVLEFCGHLTIGWSRNKWAQLKAEIAHEVASVKSESDKTSHKRYVATYPDKIGRNKYLNA